MFISGNGVTLRTQKVIQGGDKGTSGVLARFPRLLPVRNSFASYGASAVTRTSDRGHVAEAINQGHRSGGVLIRVSAQQSKKNKYHLLLLKYVTDVESPSENSELESFFWMHRGFTEYVRLLFRLDVIPNLREQLCLLAGKLLQKKEVCNKAGAYSSMRQRSDVMQEFSRQKRFFASFIYSIPQESIERMHQLLEVDNWIFYAIDHTALPVTLSHMHAPPVSVPQALPPACLRCCASLEHEEPKRRRTD